MLVKVILIVLISALIIDIAHEVYLWIKRK